MREWSSLQHRVRVAFLVAFSRKRALLTELAALRKGHDSLEERLKRAISERSSAENQAEDLRKDKERLRAKVADQKKQLESASLAYSQLSLRCDALAEELRTLKFPQT